VVKWLGRIAGYAAWFVGLLVALLLAATFIPTIFGLESLVVASGSMQPAMPVGSVALTRDVDSRAVATGDIISFRRRGSAETTTHRVVGVKVEGSQVIFTTKGDANSSPDPESVIVDDRIHRVEYVVPEAGFVVRYARSPLGAIALFVVPIAGLALERRKQRSQGPPPAPGADFGWSATTLSLSRLVPDPLRSDPSG
jgi:signal peptidase